MSAAKDLLNVERALSEARSRYPGRDFPDLEARRARLFLAVYVDEAERWKYAELLATEATV